MATAKINPVLAITKTAINQYDFVHLIFTKLFYFQEASLALIWRFQKYGALAFKQTHEPVTNSSRSKTSLAFHLHDTKLLPVISIFFPCNILYRMVICACWKLKEIKLFAQQLEDLKSALTDHPSSSITGFVLITPTAYEIKGFL